MTSALGFLLLAFTSYAAAFGATRLLLRRTVWRDFSLEAPWLTGPAFLVLIISLLGYREPFEVHAWQIWAVVLGGSALSLAVAVWDRRELAALLRCRGRQALLITATASVAAAVLLAYYPGNVWNDVFIPHVIELVNYAELASVLTGHHQGEPGTAVFEFCSNHHSLRYGQDIVVASLAQLAGLNPVQVVQPLAAFFRFQMAVALGILVFGVLREPRQWKWAVVLLLLDAILLVEVLFFSSSFLSSNCTAPLYALYLVALALRQEIGVGEGILLVLLNLFFLLTYPEFLLLTKLFEGQMLLTAWWRRQRSVWQPLLLCNLALVAMHPLLVFSKLEIMTRHLPGDVGWNLLGHPLREPFHFLANLVGLRFGDWAVEVHPALQVFGWGIALPLTLVVAVVGVWRLGQRYGVGLALLTWLGVQMALNVRSALGSGIFYPAAKVYAHTFFIVILGVAVLLASPSLRWRRLMQASVLLWLVLAALYTPRILSTIHESGYSVEYSALRDSLRKHASGQAVAVLCQANEVLHLTNLAAADGRAGMAALTGHQMHDLKMFNIAPIRDGMALTPDGVCHHGVLLCTPQTMETGRALVGDTAFRVDCLRILSPLGRLILCEGRVRPDTRRSRHDTAIMR